MSKLTLLRINSRTYNWGLGGGGGGGVMQRMRPLFLAVNRRTRRAWRTRAALYLLNESVFIGDTVHPQGLFFFFFLLV